MSKTTALYDKHEALNAKFMEFGGYNMPLRYGGDNVEHMGVRRQVGLFDVSHMGEFFVRGAKAKALLQYVTTNNVEKLAPGKAQYSCMLLPEGGIIDDLIVYQLAEEEYMVVVNAANIDNDFGWIEKHNADFGAELINRSDDMSLLALSGPLSVKTLKKLTDFDIESLPYYACARAKVADIPNVLIATTGYTGERTFELYLHNDYTPKLWDALMAAGDPFGIQPCGLAARDTLRMEMGYCLYGMDIHENVNPLEAGLGWIVKRKKGDFIGLEAVNALKEKGLTHRLVAFNTLDRGIPRHNHRLYDENDNEIGIVTSGTFSPSLRNGIGLAYVPVEYKAPGTILKLHIRKKPIRCEVQKLPFVEDTSLARWLDK